MTITDEQLQRMVAYISEVERLQSLLDDKVCAEVEFLREQIEKLQAENAKLKSKYARVIALGNLENYVGDVIDKPIKYSEEK